MLTNYAELQSSIASWLNRSDMTAQIPDFIALAEAAISNEVRLREMVKTVSIAVTDTALLPTDWLEFVHVKHDGVSLEYLPPDVLRERSDATGAPVFYSIEAGRILVNPVGSVTLDVAYYARPNVASTPGLLTTHPGLYLHKALFFAWQFLMDANKAGQAEQSYQQALSMARSAELAGRSSGSPLRIRTR